MRLVKEVDFVVLRFTERVHRKRSGKINKGVVKNGFMFTFFLWDEDSPTVVLTGEN